MLNREQANDTRIDHRICPKYNVQYLSCSMHQVIFPICQVTDSLQILNAQAAVQVEEENSSAAAANVLHYI